MLFININFEYIWLHMSDTAIVIEFNFVRVQTISFHDGLVFHILYMLRMYTTQERYLLQ